MNKMKKLLFLVFLILFLTNCKNSNPKSAERHIYCGMSQESGATIKFDCSRKLNKGDITFVGTNKYGSGYHDDYIENMPLENIKIVVIDCK